MVGEISEMKSEQSSCCAGLEITTNETKEENYPDVPKQLDHPLVAGCNVAHHASSTVSKWDTAQAKILKHTKIFI